MPNFSEVLDNEKYGRIDVRIYHALASLKNRFNVSDVSIFNCLTRKQFEDFILKDIPGTKSATQTRTGVVSYLENLGLRFADESELNAENGLLGYYLTIPEGRGLRTLLPVLLSMEFRSLNDIWSISNTTLLTKLNEHIRKLNESSKEYLNEDKILRNLTYTLWKLEKLKKNRENDNKVVSEQ